MFWQRWEGRAPEVQRPRWRFLIFGFFPGDNLWVSLVGQLSEMENSPASKWANPAPKNKASHDAQSEKFKYAKKQN